MIERAAPGFTVMAPCRVTLVRQVVPTAAVRAPVNGPLMVVVQVPVPGGSEARGAVAGIADMVATARAPARSNLENGCRTCVMCVPPSIWVVANRAVSTAQVVPGVGRQAVDRVGLGLGPVALESFGLGAVFRLIVRARTMVV